MPLEASLTLETSFCRLARTLLMVYNINADINAYFGKELYNYSGPSRPKNINQLIKVMTVRGTVLLRTLGKSKKWFGHRGY